MTELLVPRLGTSLWQPYATFICPGPTQEPIKTIETRDHLTQMRERILICAAKRRPDEDDVIGDWTVHEMSNRSWTVTDSHNEGRLTVPLGAALGVATIVGCLDTTDIWWIDVEQYADDDEDEEHCHLAGWGRNGDSFWVDHSQRPYGNYTPGRYGWLLDDIISFPQPIPVKGRQGWWRTNDETLNPGLVDLVTEQLEQAAA